MKHIFLVATILLFCVGYAHAQILTGNIKDAKTNQSLPYVNVGVVGKGIGTVTSGEGAFKITLNNNNADSLKVSMLGYNTQSFLVADVVKQTGPLNILLVPSNTQLKEVNIANHKYRQSVLGNTTKLKSVNAGFTSNDLGNEIGEIIKIKKSPTYLKQFNAALNENTSDSVKLRLNIYNVKDGMPDKNLLQQNILITVKKGQDQITVDLETYHIMVEDKFFISLEWIKDTAGHGLKFAASLLSSAIISRETSQAKWEKIGIAGVGFNVLAEY